jgi:hypothetical protein
MTGEEIEDTATHEVAYLFEKSHDPSFVKEHIHTKIASMKLPPGVILVHEGQSRPEVKKREIEKKEPDTVRCNSPYCREERELTQCPYCESYYCDEHIEPFEPGTAKFIPKREEKKHACPGWATYKEKKRQIEEASWSLDSMREGRAMSKNGSGLFFVCNFKPDYCPYVLPLFLGFPQLFYHIFFYG